MFITAALLSSLTSPAQAAGPLVDGRYVGFDYSIYEAVLTDCPTTFADLFAANPGAKVGIAGNDDDDEYAIGMVAAGTQAALSLYDLDTHGNVGGAVIAPTGPSSLTGDVLDVEPVRLNVSCAAPALYDRWFVRVITPGNPDGFLALVR